MNILRTSELQEGDVVCLLDSKGNPHEGAFLDLTVTKVTQDSVQFFRPFVHLGNFIHTGGVTPYIGTETFSTPKNDGKWYGFIENIFRKNQD